MVVCTRSSIKNSTPSSSSASSSVSVSVSSTRSRVPRVRSDGESASSAVGFSTSSFVESSIRTYKSYRPRRRGVRYNNPDDEVDDDEVDDDEVDDDEVDDDEENMIVNNDECDDDVDHDVDHATNEAADALTALSVSNIHPRPQCINPVSSITRYAYRLTVTDPSYTNPYITSYILYNNKTACYHVFNLVTIMCPVANAGYDQQMTLQTKFVSDLTHTIMRYISNLVTCSHSLHHQACVSSDFIGLVISDEKANQLFHNDTSFYDIDALHSSTSSTETLTGHEMFILAPTKMFHNNNYSVTDLNDALVILFQPEK
jgi:hypothetical protein